MWPGGVGPTKGQGLRERNARRRRGEGHRYRHTDNTGRRHRAGGTGPGRDTESQITYSSTVTPFLVPSSRTNTPTRDAQGRKESGNRLDPDHSKSKATADSSQQMKRGQKWRVASLCPPLPTGVSRPPLSLLQQETNASLRGRSFEESRVCRAGSPPRTAGDPQGDLS